MPEEIDEAVRSGSAGTLDVMVVAHPDPPGASGGGGAGPPADDGDATEDWRSRIPGRKVLRDGRILVWWVELAVMAVLYVSYEGIRDLNTGGKFEAFDNAIRVIDLQRMLGFNWELEIQQWALHHKGLIIASNYFYGSLYVIVTLSVLVWLYRKHADWYPLWRNTLLITTMLGLVGFSLYPLMPPRLLHTIRGNSALRFRDTLEMYPAFWSFGSGTMKTISNQYAAMPSLHCAWALWCTSALVPRLRAWWSRSLAVLYTACTVFVVVVSGNHYLLDALAGFTIVAVGYCVSRVFTHAGRGAPVNATGTPAADDGRVPPVQSIVS